MRMPVAFARATAPRILPSCATSRSTCYDRTPGSSAAWPRSASAPLDEQAGGAVEAAGQRGLLDLHVGQDFAQHAGREAEVRGRLCDGGSVHIASSAALGVSLAPRGL